MHLCVDGEEKNIMVTEGTKNPVGTIKRNTYLYVGHDANTIIDELVIKNTVSNLSEIFSWKNTVILSIISVMLLFAGIILVYYRKKRV